MSVIKMCITLVMAALSAAPSLAQPSDSPPTVSFISYADTKAVALVTDENPVVISPLQEKATTEQAYSFAGSVRDRWNATSIRTNAMSMEISRTGLVVNNDRASLLIYAPMQAVNGALSFVGFASQSRLNDSSVNLIQALSLVAKRQVNAELRYSVMTNSYGKLDSLISYRLNSNSDPDSGGVTIGLRYNIGF